MIWLFINLIWVDNFLISFSFGVVPLVKYFLKVLQNSFWPGSENRVRKVHYFISFAYYFPLWFCFDFFHPVIRIRSLSLRAKPWKVTFFWLLYFPDLFPTWTINCSLNSYFSMSREKSLLIEAYNIFVLSFLHLLFQTQTLQVLKQMILRFSLVQSLSVYLVPIKRQAGEAMGEI